MGEKDYMNGIIGWLTDKITGKTIACSSLTNAEFAMDSDGAYKKPDNADEIYARIPKSQEFHATGMLLMTRFNKYVLFYNVPSSKRMVRRAIRWEEKLRRRGCPEAFRKLRAAECAKYASNNGKHKHAMIQEWTFVMRDV